MAVPQILNIELPQDPGVPPLGVNPEELKTETQTCTPKFIVALFTIDKKWKQPNICPSMDE